jgi:hypothetical protein
MRHVRPGSTRWVRVGRGSIAGALLAVAGSRVEAQRTDSASIPVYRAQHAEALRQLAQDEQRLADLRRQRLALESRLDSVTAGTTAARAHALLMSDDVTALHSLDSLLTAAEHALVADRDRFLALSDAVRHHAAGTLVVVVRADSGGAGATGLDSLRVLVDSAPTAQRGYSTLSNSALAAGGTDEVYRGSILPGGHVVSALATFHAPGGGAGAAPPMSASATADVRAGVTTYVQFAWNGSKWTATTWTSASPSAHTSP